MIAEDGILCVLQEVAVVDNTTAEEMDSPQRLEQANAPPPVLPPDTQSQVSSRFTPPVGGCDIM